jgi:iron complex outermembrane recepter protein
MSRRSPFVSRPHRRTRLLAVALACSGGTLPILAMPVQAAETASAVRQEVRIAAGPLGDVLAQFAALTGTRLSFDPALVGGLRSPGLRGVYGIRDGFARLLTGSGLEIVAIGDHAYTLRKAPSTVVGSGEAMLGSVTVTAAGDTGTYIAHSAASALKSDVPLLETPRSVSVVSEEQMRERKVKSVEEAVAYTAGVQVASWGNDPRFDQISVRGFEVTTDADYRDGLRQPYTGWLSLNHTETYGLERLEIVKGPNSVLYGQISPGGLINRVSKRPVAESLHEIELQTGSDDFRQALFDFGGTLSEDGHWLYRATGLARKSNTGLTGVDDDGIYFAPALTWLPDDRTTVTFLAHWDQYETAGSPLPYQYPNGELSHTWAGDIDFDRLKQTQYSAGYEARHRFNDTLTLRQNLRVGHVDTDNQYLEATALAADGVTVSRDTYGVYETMDSFAVDTALEARFATGALAHQLALGIDYNSVDGDIRYLWGSGPDFDLSNPDYHQSVARPDSELVSQIVHGRQSGLYVNDQLSIGNWRIAAGLRHDEVRQSQEDRLAGSTERQSDRADTGNLGLLYAFANGVSPYVSYATSFMPQFGTNLYGDKFKPTEGKQVEIGLKYQPNEASTHTISVFDLVQQNVKTADPANSLNYVQTGELRSRGIELESSLVLREGFRLVASYTLQDLEVTRSNDGNEGRQPVGIPRQMAAAWGNYRFHDGILRGGELGLGARWVGRTYADTANTERNDAYTIVDARLAYDLRQLMPGATLALNATNLTDKEYLICHDGYCARGRGRSVIASLSFHW